VDVDPIQLELFRNLFEAAAEEMGIALQRTSFSANIKERRDFSCALFDANATLLAQAAHIPVHLGSMPASVAACVERLGRLREGDVAIVNDPFAGGTHLPDITLVSPVYADGTLIGYAANRAHHADVGGASPGSMTLSRHIDEEGVRIEPALLHRGGVPDDAVLGRLLSAARAPQERVGDLAAQLTANRVGAAALVKMAAAHGRDVVARCASAIVDYSRRSMEAVIAGIPDGVYRFADTLDDDGVVADAAARVPIRATLTVAGPRAVVDLRDSSPQVAGCVNCPRAVTASAAYYCFGLLLADALGEGVPMNGGCFAPIELLTTPGTVVDAAYPAAVVAGNTETSQRVVDVVLGCLAQAVPGRIPAASCGTMSSVALGTEGTGAWTYYETIGGGSGAGPRGHGASAVQCHMTNTLCTPAEALEMQYPLRVVRFERARGTGGAGAHRGGDGIVREIELLADEAAGTVLSDRRATRPWGLRADAGTAGANAILRADGTAEPLAGKARFTLRRGDRLRVTTPGGGGWAGTPTDTPHEAL
jgi:N-methylhydantoinase B